jgi:large subunit ribosomal protein L1
MISVVPMSIQITIVI